MFEVDTIVDDIQPPVLERSVPLVPDTDELGPPELELSVSNIRYCFIQKILHECNPFSPSRLRNPKVQEHECKSLFSPYPFRASATTVIEIVSHKLLIAVTLLFVFPSVR